MNNQNTNPPTEDNSNQQKSDKNNSNQNPSNNNHGTPDFETKWKRAIADLENFRKQVERERSDSLKFANEIVLETLIPVFDNFCRASAHLPTEIAKNEWARGILQIEKQFEETLNNLGLKKISAKIGQSADPIQHQIVATGEGKSGEILEILEEGYELNGKILRPTKVKVGK
jgi:molecular chaperone GrpE